MTRSPRLVLLYLGLLALLACACSNVNPTTTASVNGPGVTHVYVAIGENGSGGLRFRSDLTSTWVQSFYRSSLGTTGTLYDLSERGETIADVRDNLLPEALAVHPDLVTVWVSTEDIVSGTLLATYGHDLSQLVEALRQQGATVLLANAAPPVLYPALESCPGGANGCGPGGSAPRPTAGEVTEVTDYDNTIASVARQTGRASWTCTRHCRVPWRQAAQKASYLRTDPRCRPSAVRWSPVPSSRRCRQGSCTRGDPHNGVPAVKDRWRDLHPGSLGCGLPRDSRVSGRFQGSHPVRNRRGRQRSCSDRADRRPRLVRREGRS